MFVSIPGPNDLPNSSYSSGPNLKHWLDVRHLLTPQKACTLPHHSPWVPAHPDLLTITNMPCQMVVNNVKGLYGRLPKDSHSRILLYWPSNPIYYAERSNISDTLLCHRPCVLMILQTAIAPKYQ